MLDSYRHIWRGLAAFQLAFEPKIGLKLAARTAVQKFGQEFSPLKVR
jgi:hypothetical protein